MSNQTEQQSDAWDVVSRFLHWLSAIWIFALIGLGLVMVNMIQASGLKFELYQFHKSYGFLFGSLLIIRVLWKLFTQRPKIGVNSLMNFVSRANQLSMLFLLILLVASGYAMASLSIIPIPINVFGWNVPALLMPDMVMEQTAIAVHHYIAFSLITLVLIHSGSALFHHFVLKDRTLTRMLIKKSR
jgi:cytochrome b561